MSADWDNAIARAEAHSPFLAKGLARWPAIAALLREGHGEDALAAARTVGDGQDDTGIALRRRRNATALVLAIGDLAGGFPLDLIMRELSELADDALDAAIEAVIARSTGEETSQGFTALALGKHGACELNYSSDIDPILLFDPETLPRRERDEPGEAAQRYARELVRLLSDNTAEGYVFRVDLRLRPASEVSPLAISFDAAMSHYESSALAWERAAFIRARSAAGDVAAGAAFLDHIRPFVWRRSLDFGAIDEIRRLTVRIRQSHKGPTLPGPGYNVKLGRGGIREIEFFAQTHQLIHGGREPELRCSGTRDALDALAAHGRISTHDAQMLGESYDALRKVEHRLQMVNDHQTHVLPDGEELTNVARLAGFDGADAFLAHISAITAPVAARFAELIEEDGSDAQPVVDLTDADSATATLAKTIAARVEGWKGGRIRALRSEAARAAFDGFEEELIAALLSAADPERALARLETLLEKLPSAINLFRLLEARPGLLEQLLRVVSLAPPLADELARRPELLDPLIDRSAFDLPGSVEDLAQAMRAQFDGDAYEDTLDRIRVVTGELRFALGVQLIEAAHDPLDIAAGLCRTAEAGVQVAVQAAQDEFAKTHGVIDGGELVVVALGRFGGGQLTYASDLDIVYLFTGDFAAESDGARPLGATQYFNRLASRVSAALSVATAEGALYEIDTRLRPQGAQGPLAVSLDSFRQYQLEDAWTFEHMALSRARIVAGSAQAGTKADAIIAEALGQKRDHSKLRDDVLAMRNEIAANKASSGPLDAKLLRGGLVDLEFITHYLQLREAAHFDPDLRVALASLAKAELVETGLVEAWQFMNRLLVAARLLAPGGAIPEQAAALRLADALGLADIDAVLNRLTQCRHSVAAQWNAVFGEELEIDE